MRRAAALLLAAGLLAGCAGSTLTGRPTVGAGATASSPAPPSPTSFPTSFPTSVPSTGPSASPTAASAPSCTPPAVTASGAPFCFTRPAGMRDYSSDTDYAAGWRFRTLVASGKRELVEVLGQPVAQDLDGLTPAQSRAYAQRYALKAGAGGVRTASALTPTTVADAPAYAQHARYATGVENDARYVLHGHSYLYVSCQYLTQRALVQRSCAAVLASLRLAAR